MTTNWKSIKIQDCLETIIDNRGKTPPLSIKGHELIETTSIVGNYRYIDYEKITKHVNEEIFRSWFRGYIKPKDILIATVGANIGNIAQVKEYRGCIGQNLVGLRFNPKICNPDFAYYVLSSNKFQTILKNLNIGAAQPSIRVPHFINQSILIPSLEEQGKIADILGTLDDKIELNRQMNQTLEAMARAIFKSWFVDFDPVYAKMEGRDYPLPPEIMDLFPDELEESELGLIPKGWRVGGLGEIIEIHDSKRIPLSKKERSERKGKFPYYGATKIVDFVDDYLFDGVFLLVGEDGSVINDEGYPFLQYVWGQFWANNHAHVLNGKNGFSTEYVYLLLKKTNISPFITGAVQLKLNQENMKSIPIILPPQNMLIHFSNEINEYFSKIKNNDEQIEILTRLRELLLPKLINGLLEI